MTIPEGGSRILTEAQVREAWALTGGPSIADWPHLTDTKKWHWRNFADHILRRYGGIPTPAPAKELEARTNLLGRGGLNAALVELEARVRAIEADRLDRACTPEWDRLWTEINSLARKADDFDWKINGLLARVRALEGK